MSADEKKGKSWRDVPIGGTITRPGSSVDYKTGAWRTYKPVWHEDKCIQCLACWSYCPDCSIRLDDKGKVAGVDYDYCKGCGICARECPDKASAIDMVLDTGEPEKK